MQLISSLWRNWYNLEDNCDYLQSRTSSLLCDTFYISLDRHLFQWIFVHVPIIIVWLEIEPYLFPLPIRCHTISKDMVRPKFSYYGTIVPFNHFWYNTSYSNCHLPLPSSVSMMMTCISTLFVSGITEGGIFPMSKITGCWFI